jgi:hypothetical protein
MALQRTEEHLFSMYLAILCALFLQYPRYVLVIVTICVHFYFLIYIIRLQNTLSSLGFLGRTS